MLQGLYIEVPFCTCGCFVTLLFSDLKPPSSTKTSVYHWNKGVQDVTQEIGKYNHRIYYSRYFSVKYPSEHAVVCHQNSFCKIQMIVKGLLFQHYQEKLIWSPVISTFLSE